MPENNKARLSGLAVVGSTPTECLYVDTQSTRNTDMFIRLLHKASPQGTPGIHELMEGWRKNPDYLRMRTDQARHGMYRMRFPYHEDHMPHWSEAECREFGNDLVRAGWDQDSVARNLGITPRGGRHE